MLRMCGPASLITFMCFSCSLHLITLMSPVPCYRPPFLCVCSENGTNVRKMGQKQLKSCLGLHLALRAARGIIVCKYKCWKDGGRVLYEEREQSLDDSLTCICSFFWCFFLLFFNVSVLSTIFCKVVVVEWIFRDITQLFSLSLWAFLLFSLVLYLFQMFLTLFIMTFVAFFPMFLCHFSMFLSLVFGLQVAQLKYN